MRVNLPEENCKRLTKDACILNPWTVEDINNVLNNYASELQKRIAEDHTNGQDYRAIAHKYGFSLAHIRTQYKKVLRLLRMAESSNWYKKERITLDSHICTLYFSTRTYNSLVRNKITDLRTLSAFTPKQLRKCRYIGDATIREIEEALARHNIHLRTEVEDISSLTLGEVKHACLNRDTCVGCPLRKSDNCFCMTVPSEWDL